MFFNTSNEIGLLIYSLTTYVTGSIFLSLFSIMVLIMLFFLALRIPLELTVFLITPLIIVFMAYVGGDWKTYAGLIAIYLSIIFGKFFLT